MLTSSLCGVKATFASPFLVLCGILYTIFHDEILNQHIAPALLACFCFFATCYLFVLGGMCTIRRKPYAEIRLFEELRDCDLEIEHEIEITPVKRCIFNRIWQIFENVFQLCVFRPVYGVLLAVGSVMMFVFFYILIKMKDLNLEDDIYTAGSHLILPSLFLICVVFMMANSGMYTSDQRCKFHSYRPFQEFVEMPMTVVFGRTFAALMNGGYINLFYTLLLFASMTIAINFLDDVRNEPEKIIKALPPKSRVPDIQLLLSCLLVCIIISGFFLLGHMIIKAYIGAKRSLWAIVEKNWRRNMRAIEYLLPDVDVENLEDLEAALDAKRTRDLTDNEKKAFDYIAMPLWQTRRPFVDMTKAIDVSAEQENVEESEIVEQQPFAKNSVPQSASSGISVQKQGEQSKVSRSGVTTRQSKQIFPSNVKPAKITTRRQEFVAEPKSVDEELSKRTTIGESLQEYTAASETAELGEQTGGTNTPKTEPKRVTRRREYYN